MLKNAIPHSEPILRIGHVSKSFRLSDEKLDVLDDVTLDIAHGEFLSIIGASGCGKSTLLRIMAGLETAGLGQILFHGRVIRGTRIEIGMIFQEPRLFPWLSARENIRFGIFKASEEEDRLVDDHLALVGLADFADALPKQLSGGMQQRVSIARALINRPEILLLDEPFGALDALTRIQMQNEIIRIWRSHNTTMVLVTHDIDEAIFLSDTIVILSDRPGAVKKTIRVCLPRPRERNSVEFMSVRREIYLHFFENSTIEPEYYL
ncbi:MAG: ABC transporter ATP-binding protein [Clostridiales Family XIII bacterium]|jgi:sulfonate transport system ATP-binding protein|nr:ABC transporter ATP-binding protein [Clostridiales Family XIII bacterium]